MRAGREGGGSVKFGLEGGQKRNVWGRGKGGRVYRVANQTQKILTLKAEPAEQLNSATKLIFFLQIISCLASLFQSQSIAHSLTFPSEYNVIGIL